MQKAKIKIFIISRLENTVEKYRITKSYRVEILQKKS